MAAVEKVTRTTQKETLQELPQDQPIIEVWLTEMAATKDVALIRIFKRSATGQWAHLRKFDMEPPFTLDLDTLFTEWGDGVYRFVPFVNGRPHGQRIENVAGFGMGNAAKASPRGAQGAPGLDIESFGLGEQIMMERQLLALDGLRASRDRMTGQSQPIYQGGGLDAEAIGTMMTSMMTAMATAFAALQPKNDMMATVLGRVLDNALTKPEPANAALEFVGKVLDLKEQISGNGLGDLDWKSMLVAGLFSMTAAPEVRAALMHKLSGFKIPGMPTPPRPGAPPPQPALPPTGTQPATPPGVDEKLVEADQTLRGVIWPIIRKAIDKKSSEWGLYADLIEEHLPGFVQQWAQADFELALKFIEGIDPLIASREPATVAWLHGFHDFLRTPDADEREEPDDAE